MDAAYVLNKYWDSRIPVNPFIIAQRMGLRVLPLTGSMHGRCESDSRIIAYNVSLSETAQRFTVAHEFGHYVTGHGLDYVDNDKRNFSTTCDDPAERVANFFAVELLIPKIVVEYIYSKEKVITIESLATRFKVSEVAMKYRLQWLGIVPWNR